MYRREQWSGCVGGGGGGAAGAHRQEQSQRQQGALPARQGGEGAAPRRSDGLLAAQLAVPYQGALRRVRDAGFLGRTAATSVTRFTAGLRSPQQCALSGCRVKDGQVCTCCCLLTDRLRSLGRNLFVQCCIPVE